MSPTDRACRTWFITEAAAGTARALTEAVAARGDNVVALAADTSTLAALAGVYHGRILLITADIRVQEQLNAAAVEAVDRFGSIDVVANTAFYDLPAAVEEISDAQARAVFEINAFGVLNVLRATLPVLRAQKSGHILQASPSYSQKPAPGAGLLTASIYATDGLIDVLRAELAPLGIRVSLVDTPPTTTDLVANADPVVGRINSYEDIVRGGSPAWRLRSEAMQLDDTDGGVAALLAAVDVQEPPPLLKTGAGGLNSSIAEEHARNAVQASGPPPMLACPALAAAHQAGQKQQRATSDK
jgi:NADP-dependent 3-hydroxy acid dehydrogenase YdfG